MFTFIIIMFIWLQNDLSIRTYLFWSSYFTVSHSEAVFF